MSKWTKLSKAALTPEHFLHLVVGLNGEQVENKPFTCMCCSSPPKSSHHIGPFYNNMPCTQFTIFFLYLQLPEFLAFFFSCVYAIDVT